jgi:ANTAR domain
VHEGQDEMNGGGGASADPTATMHSLLVASLPAIGVDGAGASLVTSTGSRVTAYGSDDIATELEQLQVTLGEGPCVDAAASHSPVLIPDLTDIDGGGYSGRWPAFRAEARAAGVSALFAFPLRIGAIAFGAVDLYRRAPGGLNDEQLGTALSTMDATALAVLDLRGVLDSGNGLVEPLRNLVAHQAAGRIMVQLDCTIEEAFVRLRAASYAEGIPINDLALDVVEGRRRFEGER